MKGSVKNENKRSTPLSSATKLEPHHQIQFSVIPRTQLRLDTTVFWILIHTIVLYPNSCQQWHFTGVPTGRGTQYYSGGNQRTNIW